MSQMILSNRAELAYLPINGFIFRAAEGLIDVGLPNCSLSAEKSSSPVGCVYAVHIKINMRQNSIYSP